MSAGPATKFVRRPWNFLGGVAHLQQLPLAMIPEVAFAGRSNVGKSSLINALAGDSTVARTSNQPGRTQQLNFFILGEKQLSVVDMPGYGYAEAPKSLVDSWNRLLRQYLRGRQQLRRVLVLIDLRHGMKANDHEITKMLDEAAVSYQLIGTKADKLTQKDREKAADDLHAATKGLIACHPDVIITSSKDGEGLDAVRGVLYSFAKS